MYVRKSEREAAAKGAVLLDERKPGWHEQIDLSTLRLASETCCVLGQLFDEPITIPRWQANGYESAQAMVDAHRGYRYFTVTLADANRPVCQANYEAGKTLLGLNDTDVVTNGFEQDYDGPVRLSARYSGLDLAWEREVKQRQQVSV